LIGKRANGQTTIKRKLQDFSQNFDALTELDNQAEVRLHPKASMIIAMTILIVNDDEAD
jgi:hypothetical protein